MPTAGDDAWTTEPTLDVPKPDSTVPWTVAPRAAGEDVGVGPTGELVLEPQAAASKLKHGISTTRNRCSK
jgi:hypothetical protein